MDFRHYPAGDRKIAVILETPDEAGDFKHSLGTIHGHRQIAGAIDAALADNHWDNGTLAIEVYDADDLRQVGATMEERVQSLTDSPEHAERAVRLGNAASDIQSFLERGRVIPRPQTI